LNEQSRREFLQRAAAVSGALALAPYRSLAQATAPDSDDPIEPLQMAIARWRDADPAQVDHAACARRLTEVALDGLGGMGRFISKGDVVWIKPNIGWNRAPELAANTNPDVVATLVRLCLEAGAKQVKIGDNSCHSPRQTYRSSGIGPAAEAAGAELVYLDERRFKEVDLGGSRLKSWPVYPEILAADLVINVPVVKHHGLSTASLCLKNFMGIVGGDRGKWHQDLPACLIDITRFMQPRLCVLDAVRILTDHGPQGGNPRDVTSPLTVAAGTDIVALDALGAELLGHQPDRIQHLRAAHEAGLGQLDYRLIAHRELAAS